MCGGNIKHEVKDLDNIEAIFEKYNGIFNCGKNIDMITRELEICGKKSYIFFIDGFAKESVIEKILEFLLSTDDSALMENADVFARHRVPYNEIELTEDCEAIKKGVFSGMLALFVDGFSNCILIDTREYPQRETSEPEKDKVFRGSKDGFVETIILNAALIRRRIRMPELMLEPFTVGESSKTDVAVCYIDGRADKKTVGEIKRRISNLKIDALTMNQQTLSDHIFKTCRFNPFPKIKYTERPDTASAQILEGDVIILVDNSPSAMIIPSSFFDLMDEANDYYFPPLTGTYLRLTRFAVMITTLFLTPLWLLFVKNPGLLPENMAFLGKSDCAVPVFLQLIILEVAVDGLKLASLYTPNMLSTPLSMIGAIVLGDFAVNSGLFSAEAMLYMAFVTVANFSIPSYEMGYALKFTRIVLLAAVQIFGGWGLAIAAAAIFVLLSCSKTVTGKGYMYPLVPFDGKMLAHKLFRMKEE